MNIELIMRVLFATLVSIGVALTIIVSYLLLTA